MSTAPRWVFFRLAVPPPDRYVLDLGQPARAAAVLMSARDRYAGAST